MSVTEKLHLMYQVWIKEASTNEPLITCRNCIIRCQNQTGPLVWDRFGGNLLTDQAAPGIKMART